MDTNTINVLIVGVGPGLALALDPRTTRLAFDNHRTNSSTETELLVKADYPNDRGMEFCRILGVRDDVANVGFPNDVSRDIVFAQLSMAVSSAVFRRPSLQVLCPQLWFDPLLARAFMRQEAEDIRYGIEFSVREQDDTCFLTHVEGSRMENTRAWELAGCDGLTSTVQRVVFPSMGLTLDTQLALLPESTIVHGTIASKWPRLHVHRP
ncbi:hypothetical protein BGW36DRAFT_381637 [Talaromyces proteolyticus]|uniref:FAD-binding domain-containing protein n=1 Tax=Talaromyces proteolyticus TaxID=1131652 RepID=A0AAD4KMH5_9EURO|nr:uncharacterized protein BGW36DRAFT_381637 [Talaromyces proteolyticus]KAH8694884.1 hypothetical protein BGW36DRAFT_381637 [Talaromyces proteolyticus]